MRLQRWICLSGKCLWVKGKDNSILCLLGINTSSWVLSRIEMTARQVASTWNSYLKQPLADSYWKSKLTRDMNTLQKITRLRLKTSSRINLQSMAPICSLVLIKGIFEWTCFMEEFGLDLLVSNCSLILPEWCRIAQFPGARNPSGK